MQENILSIVFHDNSKNNFLLVFRRTICKIVNILKKTCLFTAFDDTSRTRMFLKSMYSFFPSLCFLQLFNHFQFIYYFHCFLIFLICSMLIVFFFMQVYVNNLEFIVFIFIIVAIVIILWLIWLLLLILLLF